LPEVLVKSFDAPGRADAESRHDVTGYAELLDRVAKEAARQGIDFEAQVTEQEAAIAKQIAEGSISEQQGEFMMDESDALIALINWAHTNGYIDKEKLAALHEVVN